MHCLHGGATKKPMIDTAFEISFWLFIFQGTFDGIQCIRILSICSQALSSCHLGVFLLGVVFAKSNLKRVAKKSSEIEFN